MLKCQNCLAIYKILIDLIDLVKKMHVFQFLFLLPEK